jgi:hypothetical protein
MGKRLTAVLAFALCLAAALPAAGQDSDTSQFQLNAALLAAARNGDEATVRRVVEKGASVDSRNRAGDTALLIFVRKSNLPMTQYLIARGANVNQPNLDKVTPLMTAAYNGDLEVFKALLAAGADVSPRDQVFKTAMVYAAGKGHAPIVQGDGGAAARPRRGCVANRRAGEDGGRHRRGDGASGYRRVAEKRLTTQRRGLSTKAKISPAGKAIGAVESNLS